jgi:gamma-glutamyltranspeptidase / glutathione hydrolase
LSLPSPSRPTCPDHASALSSAEEAAASPGSGTAVTGPGGVTAAGSPQAAQTAAAILSAGGTAVDAAIAASAVQCVVEFPWCGLGGDGFLLIRPARGDVVAINGSGAAPGRAAEGLDGLDRVPRFGPRSVAVPGLVSAWELAHGRFGTRPLPELLEPAIGIARDGFAADPRLSSAIKAAREDPSISPGLAALLAGSDGTRFAQPDLATTLAEISSGGSKYFYRGAFARQMADHLTSRGGVLSAGDMAAHTMDWSRPLAIGYRGHVIYEHPPVSLGSILLQELRIFEQCDSSQLAFGSAGLIDLMVRCKIAAFADAFAADDSLGVDARLSLGRARWWRDRLPGLPAPPGVPVVGDTGAGSTAQAPVVPGGPDTTCLAVRDAAGTTVTVIHSLFNTFGSREVVEGTGVILNDRLASLAVPGSGPAGGTVAGPRLAPGGRPPHTLNSYLVVRGDDVVIAGATPGGRGQVQTSFQVLVNLVDKGMNPLEAVCAPRWMHGTPRTAVDDGALYLEAALGQQTVARLADLGHAVRISDDADEMFGSCTAVGSAPSGSYAVADGRRGSAADST